MNKDTNKASQTNVSSLLSTDSIRQMSASHVHGPGRDRRFALKQYFIDVDHIPTAYFDAGQGPVIIFIHGLAGNLTHWIHIAPHFVDAGYRVIGLDLPGCGQTPVLPSGYSMDGYGEHLLHFMDALGVEHATLAGHSLGGMAAMEVARRAPDRVTGLYLIGPAGFQPVPRLARLAGQLVLSEPLLNAALPRVWQGVVKHIFERDNEYTRSFIANIEATYDPLNDIQQISAVVAGLKQDFLYRSYEAALQQVKVPVHLVWGKQDRLVPAKQLSRLAERNPHVEIELVPDCGHMPLIETPAVVIEGLQRLLDHVGSAEAA